MSPIPGNTTSSLTYTHTEKIIFIILAHTPSIDSIIAPISLVVIAVGMYKVLKLCFNQTHV
jgi:hypothetical protein